ncbi:MAG: Uma2 family endonuclease [Pirellulaceae bacterium]|nr:Uma2 family endonuclease [Pirellulaceae bacterium]
MSLISELVMTNATASRATAKSKLNGRLPIVVNGEAEIPAWVRDHASYRKWARSDDFPEGGRFAYLNGTIWADFTMEQVFTHNQVKTAIAAVLYQHVKALDLGYVFSDGTLLSHDGAGLSCEPDACFLTYETVASKLARWIRGASEGYVEVEGTPDLVLEVVSTSSVRKDNVTLRDLYWRAGIREYWLVDARATPLKFSLLRHQAKGYVEARKQPEGWLKSAVFGRSFRLVQRLDRLGQPTFDLEVRE